MTPCKPEVQAEACASCARYSEALPDDPEQRTTTLVMDASVLPWRGRVCPMYEWKRQREAA